MLKLQFQQSQVCQNLPIDVVIGKLIVTTNDDIMRGIHRKEIFN